MDYQRTCASAEAFIYAAMIRLMVRCLARVLRISKQFQKMSSRKSVSSILHNGCPQGASGPRCNQ